MTYRRKLIEAALPLEAINEGSKPETDNPFLKGHPRAIHNWWARTPLSVCRAVLFAQLVDDPGDGLPPAEAKAKRAGLSDFVARLATWNATTDPELIASAKALIAESAHGEDLQLWDMFAGRASIPQKVHLCVPRLAHNVYRRHPLLGHCVLLVLSSPDTLMKHTVAFLVNHFSTTPRDTTATDWAVLDLASPKRSAGPRLVVCGLPLASSTADCFLPRPRAARARKAKTLGAILEVWAGAVSQPP